MRPVRLITVASTENETIDLSIDSISDGSGDNIEFSLSSPQVIINTVSNPSRIITVDYVVDSGFNFEFAKTYTAVINAAGTVSDSVTKYIDLILMIGLVVKIPYIQLSHKV